MAHSQLAVVWRRDIFILILLNALILMRIIGVSDIAGVFFLIFLPGVLIQRTLVHKVESLWEQIVHTVALSVSFVMFAGLIANTLLPVLGISHPLERLPILLFFDVLLLTLIVVNAILGRNKELFVGRVPLRNTPKDIFLHLSLFVLPVFAIAGANVLSNGGTNVITIATILLVTIFLFYVVSTSRNINDALVVTGLYCSSLALLLVTSMRSLHVVGWDVNSELHVFRLTHDSWYWSMAHMQDAYNACLSITLLPTIFLAFIHTNDEYIYKFLFQLIFALMPIVAYYFVGLFTNTRVAKLAVVMLVGNVVFLQGMPALIRQEFGFLYFGLILLVLFSRKLSGQTRYSLAAIYGLSMIVSHYSTTYIAVLLLTLMILLNSGLGLVKKVLSRLPFGRVTHEVSVWYVLFLVVGTIIWNSVVTSTSNGIFGFIEDSKTNIAESFTYDTLLRAKDQIFMLQTSRADLQESMEKEAKEFRRLHSGMYFYGPKETDLWKLELLAPIQSPALLGHNVQRVAVQLFQILKVLRNDLFIVFGMALLIFYWIKGKFHSSEFIFLAISGIFLLGLLLILPNALQKYNIERLYYQLLIVWAWFSIEAGVIMLAFLSVRKRFITLGMLYCTLTLFSSSVVFAITGGPMLVSANNFGTDYGKFYVHDSEISAVRWLEEKDSDASIFSDVSGFIRLQGHSNIDKEKIYATLLPSMIDRNSYVLLSYMNLVAGISIFHLDNKEYLYATPIEFLDANKDAIYSNGSAKIFR